ncbi:MAG TPA: hypothetical protein PLV68_06025, partial [Ilumatobacteraceae bacterium]|nr:hypothetical protein [Ilumatobacteraceae bacterium]
MTVTLTKYHGLGNDFLVCDTREVPVDADWVALARAWCERRRGMGADGLLSLTLLGDAATTTELAMVLHNADGSRAEMSGNGIRCLVHAAFIAQQRNEPVTYRVHTDAGLRSVDVVPDDTPGQATTAPVTSVHASVA